MDTLLIPCFDRPELLHETLGNLVRTGDLGTVHVIFKPDMGHHSDIRTVIDHYTPDMLSFEVIPPTTSRYRLTKQSFNVLSGYAIAASKSTGLVFMVEEDIQVSTDFFRYHRAIHAKEHLFASLSTKNHNRNVSTTDDPEAYYLSTSDYCSLGVCMRATTITDLITPHLTEHYLRDPVKYCAAHFPGAPFAPGHAEQDGLIRRIQHTSDLPTAYPHVPRAFHSGWYGYNRKRSPLRGTLQDKINKVRETIYDTDKARAAAINPAWAKDSEPVNLNIEPWNNLKHSPI